MKAKYILRSSMWIVLSAFYFIPTIGFSQDPSDLRNEYSELKQTVKELTAKLAVMESKLDNVTASSADSISVAKNDMPNAFAGDSSYHISGYADVGYYGSSNGDDSFGIGHFAPIVHYQYKDLILFEGELAFGLETDEEGRTTTETEIEYLALNLFVNDYMTLVAGKFLSPIGQFQQNLHPSWINKLPSMPIGFSGGDHGSGAAPTAEIGAQVRGGIPIAGSKLNYSFFAGNGPEMVVVEEDGEFEIEKLDTTGSLDSAGNLSTGGRLGFLPISNFEIGVSLGVAEASVAEAGGHSEEEDAHDEEPEEEEHDEEIEEIGNRDYLVYGFDFYYTPQNLKNLVFRGEYVRTELGEGDDHEPDNEEKVWEAWYVQASYVLDAYRLEPVLRYGEYTDAHGEALEQWAIGINYLFSNNVIGKIAYEFNDSEDSEPSDDRFAIQLAYGF